MRILTVVAVASLCLLFAPRSVHAAALSPVLGQLIDGGAFDGSEDYIKTTNSGEITVAGPVANLTVGDTFQIVSSFAGVGSSAASAGDPLLGTGFAAVVWSGRIASIDFSLANITTFAQIESAGDLDSLLGNLGISSGFATLLTSESFDFSGKTIGDINAEALSGTIDSNGVFDLNSPTASFQSSFNTDEVEYAFAFSTDVQIPSLPDGLDYLPNETDSSLLIRNNSAVGSLSFAASAGSDSGGTFTASGSNLAQINPVPEPGSVVAMVGLFAFFGSVSRRRRKS
jgi:hypothetical protein